MKRKSISYAKWGYIFLIPFFVVYIIFSLYPLFQTFYYSFTDYVKDQGSIGGGWTRQAVEVTPTFCGFDNYSTIFTSGSDLLQSFWNTIIMWIVGFIPQIVISLILAVWFTDLRLKIKAQGFFKAVIYLPNVIMASAFAFLFYSLFSRGGAIYDLIKVPLLESVWGSRGVVGLINFILWYGNTTILLMAAIMGVDTSLYESAQIDGATQFQIFGKIALPLSKPLMATIALFLTFGYWNDWFQSSLYISDTKLYSLQALLDHVQRNIEVMANNPSLGVTTAQYMNSMPKEGARMAMAIIIIIPIACCYPFFQKYFISGLTVGAVKG